MSPQALDNRITSEDHKLTDPLDMALVWAAVGLANVDRALHGQSGTVTSPHEVHPDKLAQYVAGVLEAGLRQQPGAMLVAVHDSGNVLLEFVQSLLKEPDAAIARNAGLLADACDAMTRKVLDAFSASLASALPGLLRERT